mgnify:CR=1 FL=1
MAVTAVGGNNFNAPRAKETTPAAREPTDRAGKAKGPNPNDSQKTAKNIAPTEGPSNGSVGQTRGSNIDFRA